MSSISAFPLRCQVAFYAIVGNSGRIKTRLVSINARWRVPALAGLFAFLGGMTHDPCHYSPAR